MNDDSQPQPTPSTASPSGARAATPRLSEVEARIVGSLIEKEATTPDAYPLTGNAIVLACNQKTAREPMMQLTLDEVSQALRHLEVRGWVKSQHSGRAERYAHRFEKVVGVTRAQAALLALLMLRGPQTLYELTSRSERLADFASTDDVQYALDRLTQREPALVQLLPRQGGQREDRYAHLLSGEPALPAIEGSSVRAASNPGLAERVSALEARVAELEALLASREPQSTHDG